MADFDPQASAFNTLYFDDQADANDLPGPQQSRKPPATASSNTFTSRQPIYDPRSLLNPQASSTRQAAAPPAEDAQVGDFGVGNMIANLHDLTDRADVPTSKKRKSPALENGELDHEHKKHKATFYRAGQGGVISDHINQQNRADAPPHQQAGPIDLTADDDDDEVVVISETNNPTIPTGSPNEDVILGRLVASANVFRVPAPRRGTAAGKDVWPPIMISFRKENPSPQNHVIDLYDPAKAKFGTLDARVAIAISQLLAGQSISKFRCSMALHGRAKLEDDYAGKRVSQSLMLDITLYAAREKADQIGRFLSQKQLFLSNPLHNTGNKAIVNPHMPAHFGQGQRPQAAKPVAYVTRTAEEMRTEASSMFDKISNDEALPELEANTDIIKTPLLDHQKKGLAFLVDHERSNIDVDAESSKHSLWKYQPDGRGRPSWYHVITGHETNEKPQGIQGGILADVMGLGKTLSILSLIAETRDESRRFRRNGEKAKGTDCNAKATLIICPKSVLSNWREQIEAHCVLGNLMCYMYHGSNRTQDTDFLSKHDVVLTSYNTAAAEFGDGVRKKRALASINWFRIVLDEAHSIRTQSTQVSKACCALNAQRRWAVTGTPVQNSLTDLGTLIKFLRIKPFDDSHTWSQHIMAKFKLADATVVEQLQLLVGSITLRRSKDTIGLVERKEERQPLDWAPEEYHLYSQFAKMSRTHFHNITGGGSAIKGKAYAHVLKSIGRLRAICAHGREMLTEEDMEEIKGGDPSSAIVLDIGDEPGMGEDAFDGFIKEKQAYETFTNMQDSEVDSCIRCGEKLGKKEDDAFKAAAQELEDDGSSEDEEEEDVKPKQDLLGHLTPCYHLICADCTEKHKADVEKSLTADKHHSCPHCESYVRYGLFPILRSTLKQFVDNRKAARKVKAARWDEDSYTGPHSKVLALLEALGKSAEETAALPPGEPPIRSAVFSGWTSYLDLIEYALEKHNIGFVRLDGTMSVKQRTQSLDTFKTDPNVVVLIASIKAAGQGLNLTSANKAYVMEPQFNPGVEEQAVDRVHRLGQTRPVHIVHYIMTPSVEEGILKLQKKKKKLAALSMERKRSKVEEVAERLQDVRDLFK